MATPSGSPRTGLGIRGLAIVVAAAVVLTAGGALLYALRIEAPPTGNSPPGLPPDTGNTTPHEVRKLSEGRTRLGIPFMTMYSAPALKVRGFGTSVSFSLSSTRGGPSTTFTFRWEHVTGTSLPVRFVLDTAPIHPHFDSGPTDGFRYLPVGLCVAPCLSDVLKMSTAKVGAQLAYFAIWRMDYSVHEMQALRNHVNVSWLQVDYSFSPQVQGTEQLPVPNATAAGPTDLAPVGDRLGLRWGPGQVWQYNVSIHDFVGADRTFLHSIPPIVLDAGPVGHLTAVLTSSFAWGPSEDYRLGLSGTDGVNATVQFYVDTRFGALFVQYPG
jgi:hypothetical protein